MIRRFGPALVAVAVLASLLTASPAPVAAQNEEERLRQVESEIRDLQRQISDARNERSEYAAQLAETQERMDALLAVLAEAESALALINEAIVAKEGDIAELQRKVKILQAQIAETQIDQRSTRTLIRDRAVQLYMSGNNGLGTLGLGVDDVQSASVSIQYAGNLLAETGTLLRSLEVLENQEEQQRGLLEDEQDREETVLASLNDDRVAAEDHKATIEVSRSEIQSELDAQEELLAKVNAEISVHESHIGALERESRELEQEIARRQVREGSAPGRLAFPVPGPVTSPYGWRIHPIFGTRKLHAGIDLQASTGDRIRAAGNGTVILASTWGGYGRTVIIDHGGGLSTLYAHQSRIAVSLGAEVSAGDTIGYIGCSGYCTGAHLHFETREFGTPVDPMGYLR